MNNKVPGEYNNDIDTLLYSALKYEPINLLQKKSKFYWKLYEVDTS